MLLDRYKLHCNINKYLNAVLALVDALVESADGQLTGEQVDAVIESAMAREYHPKIPDYPRVWAVAVRPRGTEFLDAETGGSNRPERPLRDRKSDRRPKQRNDTGENPHRNGLFWLGLEICGLV